MSADENEKVEMGSEHEGSQVELVKLHAVDEIDSRSRGVDKVRERDVQIQERRML